MLIATQSYGNIKESNMSFIKDTMHSRYTFNDGISVSFDLIEDVQKRDEKGMIELETVLSSVEFDHIQTILEWENAGD